MPNRRFVCSKCGRTFTMKAHLVRHQNAGHGVKRKTAKRKVKTARRSSGAARRFGFSRLSLDELGNLLRAARVEGQRRIAEIAKVVQ
jgi:uncharacterized C2H2 Zn-finger protein